MRFDDLSHDAQVALAAWALLVKSSPLTESEVSGFPDGYNRALGEICTTVGLRKRKARNHALRGRTRNTVRRKPRRTHPASKVS